MYSKFLGTSCISKFLGCPCISKNLEPRVFLKF